MRYPAVAGRFYSGDRDELVNQIEWCFSHPLGPGKLGKKGNERKIVGGLCPHAGYVCSGMNAAHFFKNLYEDGLPEAYVVIGPDHYGIGMDVALCSESYLTPLGECRIHEEIADRLKEKIRDCPEAHSVEHSVEVEIPFIQYIDPGAKIIPIIMSNQSFESAEKLSSILSEACKGIDVVFVASSDLSHYVPKSVAEKNDTMVLDAISEKNVEKMYSSIMKHRITACGYGPIAVALTASKAATTKILKHTDSSDALGYGSESVVGYGSAVFFR